MKNKPKQRSGKPKKWQRLGQKLSLTISLLACAEETSDAGKGNSGKNQLNWDEVTHDISGRPIERPYLYYTVYIDGVPIEETTRLFYDFRVKKDTCVMVYVTATRTDGYEFLESEPSSVVGVCNG